MWDPFAPGCRKHGPGCSIPWGYDPEHTDSPRPYSVDELAERGDGPHRYAYPSHDAHLYGWNLWKALRRDSRLTSDERDAVDSVRLARLGIQARNVAEALEQMQGRVGA